MPRFLDERALAVQWDGIAGPIAGIIDRDGEGDGRLRVQLSSPDRQCIGTLSMSKGSATGSWAIACPDGAAASGTFAGKGRNAGGEGTGTDTAGRRVAFVVGPAARASTARAKPAGRPVAKAQPSADELNQAEIERKRAERRQEPQDAVRRNRPEAEVANAHRPAPPAASPTALRAAPGNVVQCGFMRVEGLAARPGTTNCQPDTRVGHGGDLVLTIEIASLAVRLEPNNAFLLLYGEKDADGRGGFRTSGDEQLRKSAESWAGGKAGRNYSRVEPGPFRHVKLNISENGDWACVWGQLESGKRAWGGGGVRSYAFVRYCERGAHTVSDDNLRMVAAAVRLG